MSTQAQPSDEEMALKSLEEERDAKETERLTEEGIVIPEVARHRNLVDILVDYIQNGINTHPDWALLLTCSAIGMMAGDTILLIDEIGPVQANIFGTYIGPSGLGKKSIALKYRLVPLIEMAEKIANNKHLEKYGLSIEALKTRKEEHDSIPKSKRDEAWEREDNFLSKLGKETIDYMIPSKSTQEAMVGFLSRHPQGIIVSDEFTSTLKGVSSKDYMREFLELLSLLYDNRLPRSLTIKRGLEETSHLNVCFVSCTTPYFFDMCKDTTPFKQGYFNRLLVIYDLSTEKFNEQEELDNTVTFWNASLWTGDAHETATEKAADWLYSVTELHNMEITPYELDAQYALNGYIVSLKKRASDFNKIDPKAVESNYYSRMVENVIKLAMIRTIGRYATMDEVERQYDDYMKMNTNDINWAIEVSERFIWYFKKTLEELKLNVESPLKSYKSTIEAIFSIIDSSVDGCTTIAQICKKTGWLAKDLQPIFDQMMKYGQIKIEYDVINPKTGQTRNEVRRKEAFEQNDIKCV